jgi:hypothetical protein
MRNRTLYLLSFLTLLSFTHIFAQDAAPPPGTITVFSEDGEKFTLYLNEEVKNATPASRVVVAGVAEVPIAFRIVFENGSVPEIKKRGLRQGTNCVYFIEKNKKGERGLKMRGCTDEAVAEASPASAPTPATPSTPSASAPAQLSATYASDVITINDGRTLSVKKVKVNGMTYPRVRMTALPGANVSIAYDNSDEKFSAESPLEYEVKDFSNNNAYFTLTVDEGGPAKTWHVKLKNSNGFDLKIE